MKSFLICKLTDSKIYLYNSKTNQTIIEYIKSNIIKNNKIVDIYSFINSLDRIIKKHKLNNNILKSTIYILMYNINTPTDEFLIDYTFKMLNYYNYKIIRESCVYSELLTNDNAIIDLWDDFGEITYKIKGVQINEPFEKKDINNIPKNTIVIINNTKEKLKLKNSKKEIYYLEQVDIPIINMLIKTLNKDLSRG